MRVRVVAVLAFVLPAGCHSFDDGSICDTDAENLPTSCPARIPPQPAVRALARTLGPSNCALLQDGGVRCWGANQFGQLGDGSTIDRLRPVEIPQLHGALEVTLGTRHGCAVMADHKAMCWGVNESGQLGDGTQTTRLTPAPVRGLTNVRSMALGDADTCAVTVDGAVQCWGSGAFPVDGTKTQRSTPATVQGLSRIMSIAASMDGVLAHDGESLFFWGLGKSSNVSTPTAFGQHFKSISAGIWSVCGVYDDSVFCWGGNHAGAFGYDDPPYVTAPTPAPGFDGAMEMLVGGDFACSLRTDRTLTCAGGNDGGQLGMLPVERPPAFPHRSSVAIMPGIADVQSGTAGQNHVCVLTSTSLLCWGSNANGEVGIGTQTGTEPTPKRVLF